MKTLLILRHGKSDWSTGLDDFDRPLVGRGRRGSRKMGAWIRHLGLLPDAVLSSPAARARGTTEAACKAMGLALKDVRWDERLYEAPLERHLAVIAGTPKKAERLLLVGHNPGLEELIIHLADRPPEIPADGKLLPTSALARLEFSGDWGALAAGSARLLSVTRPGEVPEDDGIWPQPAAASKRRAVPEHFFIQSAVIPYRFVDGQLQFLLVASRKGTRWVIPKGVKEAGQSAHDSAAREAFEEAGLRGKVDVVPLGHYAYEKWGGTCSVTVFPMAVSECLPDGMWEESHRKRRWVSLQEAIEHLDEPGLCKLVTSLANALTRS